jgi:hypothetical protein
MVGISSLVLPQEKRENFQVSYRSGTGKGSTAMFIDLIDERSCSTNITNARRSTSFVELRCVTLLFQTIQKTVHGR